MGLHGQPQDKLAGSCQPGLLRRGRRIRRGDSGFRGSQTVPVAPNAIPDPALSALQAVPARLPPVRRVQASMRSEEHTSELQSQMRTSYAAFCWEKKTLLT